MEFVDLYAQYLSIRGEIDDAIAAVIRESAFIRGRHVDEFERRYAELLGIRRCVSCSDGTTAIYIALRALGLGHGDEVITTAHSWIATTETVTQAGGKVVFADTEDAYYCIDPVQIERRITPRTRGIIAVHLYGQPADMDAILDIASRHGLWVIEDCAQAHLSTYKGRMVGTMGDIATFSFYPGKNLGAMGDAGCLVTNRDDLADFATLFARHGGKGDHLIEGINSRLDGLQAAILNVKLRYLEGWTKTRKRLARRYDELLSDVAGIAAPAIRPDAEHVYHLYVIRSRERDQLRAHLQSRGIPTVVNYPKALPFYPAYAYMGHKPADFPVAYAHQHEILSLPLYAELEEEQQRNVVDAIREFDSSRAASRLVTASTS
ncbi:MAG TPA: DegT/DnrJ/EryC1/StrS family aminotransferase [Gemmatimonadaceae bacterium]|nr:DegT/DnrJ/EryC1/StrS family aminotransferase [Gemmatimonadaceae bacterium]